MNTPLRPPGPPNSLLAFRQQWAFRRDPLHFLEGLSSRYGDIVFFQSEPQSFFLLNHPDFIRLVLDEKQACFTTCQGFAKLAPESAEPFPGDVRKTLAEAAPGLVEAAAHLADGWQDGQVLDLQDVMGRLATTLRLKDNHLWRTAGELAACAMTWTLALLASQPELQQQLDTEIRTVLAGRPLVLSDLEGLPFTRQMVNETLRLYPPAWLVVRQAVRDTLICGYAIPAGATILMSPWVMQRDARFFPDPLSFDPGRWALEAQPGLPKYVFFPFGAGSQAALAGELLQVVGPLFLAVLAQKIYARGRRFLLPLGNRSFAVQPSDLLRPKHGLRVAVERHSLS